jgi:D-aminoacyl-tRNA deacylase
MRALIQRVSRASVRADGQVTGEIQNGLLVLLGVGDSDEPGDALWLAEKIVKMRIFSDAEGKMNKDVLESEGGLLVVSQFTLFASTSKGNRPSFVRAAKPDQAILLYKLFLDEVCRFCGHPAATGIFGAHMEVSLLNDGPVTIWLDSRNRE